MAASAGEAATAARTSVATESFGAEEATMTFTFAGSA